MVRVVETVEATPENTAPEEEDAAEEEGACEPAPPEVEFTVRVTRLKKVTLGQSFEEAEYGFEVLPSTTTDELLEMVEELEPPILQGVPAHLQVLHDSEGAELGVDIQGGTMADLGFHADAQQPCHLVVYYDRLVTLDSRGNCVHVTPAGSRRNTPRTMAQHGELTPLQAWRAKSWQEGFIEHADTPKYFVSTPEPQVLSKDRLMLEAAFLREELQDAESEEEAQQIEAKLRFIEEQIRGGAE